LIQQPLALRANAMPPSVTLSYGTRWTMSIQNGDFGINALLRSGAAEAEVVM
jgi:hypothetical protein